MRVSLVLVTALAVGLLAAPAWTKSGGAHGSYPSGTQAHAPAAAVAHDSHGHIARNVHAKDESDGRIRVPVQARSTAHVLAGWSITFKR